MEESTQNIAVCAAKPTILRSGKYLEIIMLTIVKVAFLLTIRTINYA